MASDEERIGKKQPLTAELGDEGGSYSDASVQAETFKGGRGNPRIDPKAVAPDALTADSVTADAEPNDLVRHADESPEDDRPRRTR